MKQLEIQFDRGKVESNLTPSREIALLQEELHAAPPGCLGLPNRLAQEYIQSRDHSTLGQIFRIANRSTDHIDAVVVLGHFEACLPSRLVFDALCDPYHNEQTRAQRGSKPRVYHVDQPLDNDACDAVLRRLDATDHEEAPCRYAIVSIEDGQDVSSVVSLRQVFVEHLQNALGSDAPTWLPHLVTRISSGDQDGDIQQFERTPESSGLHGVLTSAALLPAAYLGLDCMKLAEGALKMNHRVSQCGPEHDSQLWCWLQCHWGCRPQLQCWDQSLVTLGAWAERLGANRPLPVRRLTNLEVTQPRSDLISNANEDFGVRRRAATQSWRAAKQTQEWSVDQVSLPTMNAFSLGQLVQLLLIVNHSD